MPLILITGLPSSGKSTTAAKIYDYFKTKVQDGKKIKLISDSDALDWDGRDTIYMSIPKEKELRSWLKSEAQRYLNLNQIVILDAANYIKGYRYELFCICKETKTQYCVVEHFVDKETCWRWNKERKPVGYNRETFDALFLRYEKCDETNRWDSPLLRTQDDQLDLEKIYNIITKEEPLASNKCTTLSTTTTTIFKPC